MELKKGFFFGYKDSKQSADSYLLNNEGKDTRIFWWVFARHNGTACIQKGMNPFAAGMSMFVSLLSAMTIIGLPVEGTGPQTVLLDRPLVT